VGPSCSPRGRVLSGARITADTSAPCGLASELPSQLRRRATFRQTLLGLFRAHALLVRTLLRLILRERFGRIDIAERRVLRDDLVHPVELDAETLCKHRQH